MVRWESFLVLTMLLGASWWWFKIGKVPIKPFKLKPAQLAIASQQSGSAIYCKRSLAELSAHFPYHKVTCEIFGWWKALNLKKFSQVIWRIFNNKVLHLLLERDSQKMPNCLSETRPNQHFPLPGFLGFIGHSPRSFKFCASFRLCSSSLTQHRKGIFILWYFLSTQILYL